MENEKITIVLVDDHSMFREGIKFLLSQIDNVEVIGEAENGSAFLDLLENLETPSIVLLDINMPVMNGIEACTLAVKKHPGLKIIALSMNDEQEYYYQMVQAGARGFLLKKDGKDKLTEALTEVLNGGSYFPEDILRKIIFKFGTDESAEKSLQNKFGLTKREKEVLYLLCQGYTNHEIAEKLFLSTKTIEGHRANLLSKTGTKNSAHLVMFAIKRGILKI